MKTKLIELHNSIHLTCNLDLCHAFENLMLALCKYQKWKEKVKISE